LRAVWRILRVALFLAAFTIRMRLTKPADSSPEFEQWRREYFGGACRGILERLGVRVRARGEFPDSGGILVTNHLSYLVVLVLASLGPTVFVSRADVAHWPLIGPLTRWCSTIYIEREKRDQLPEVISRMGDALRTGSQVVFFPEGTSGAGDEVMPFRPSLFGVAADGEVTVRAAVISYQTVDGDPPARDSVCWWGDAGFVRHFIGLAGLRRVAVNVGFLEGELRSSDRKELARRCHEAISRAFEPVTGSEGAA
jgi:1-acyl-sn-glycerol-3-phosphate acyltransferase